MLGVDFGKLRQRLGLLERRLESWQRGEPISVSTSQAPDWHAAESAIDGRNDRPLHDGELHAWSAGFQECRRALAGADDRRLATLVELGIALTQSAVEPQRLRQHLDVLLDEVRGQTDRTVERTRQLNRGRAAVDLVLAAYQDVLANRRPPMPALGELARSLLAESAGSAPQLDFRMDDAASRNLAQQGVNVAALAGFLAAREATSGYDRESLLVAALLMDAPLLDALGLPDAAAAERRATHGRDAALLLAHLGLFDVNLLAAVERHHASAKAQNDRTASDAERILAVAAAYVDNRWRSPDRASSDPRQALRTVLLDAERGTLDLDRALKLLEVGFFPVGTLVELATGEWAEVVATHKVGADFAAAALPVVRIRRTALGALPARPEYRNLALVDDARIVRELTPAETRKLAAD